MTDFITILLKNGTKFHVQGVTCDDVATMSVSNHSGWAHFELLNGNSVQIWAEEIAAIYEERGFA